jgi:uncharacterized Zn finger protein
MAGATAISEAAIRALADPQSFDRGRQYYKRGAVVRLARRGGQLQAEVEGSEYQPYRVAVTLHAGGIGETACTCPYDWGGACKHIVAVLLAAMHEPQRIEEQPPLDQTLAALDRDQLQALLLALAERHPDLADAIEALALAASMRAAPADAAEPAGPRTRQTALDPKPFRRQVQAALHSLDRMRPSEAYWQVGGVVGEVLAIAAQARPFIDAGDGRNALVILEAVTQEYVDGWFNLDGSDGDTADAFSDLGALLTEAILTADLTPAERDAWAQRLAGWDREVSDYGVEDAFGAARAAALQGWDDPRLLRILHGDALPEDMRSRPASTSYVFDNEGDDASDNFDEADDENDLPYDERWYADQLTTARLNVLDRQGRHEEYLNLAIAEGRRREYVTTLVRLGRVADAVEHGRTSLTSAEDALALARALHEHGATEDALRIAEHGLTLAGEHLMLARWLRDQATAAGDGERALSAAHIAVRRSVDLNDYCAVQALAGDRWPAQRDELLVALRGRIKANPYAGVAILLHEGMIDEAIALADEAPYQYEVVEQVADAALESRPEWVIHTCRAQAERIMDEGKSKYYHHAAEWLRRGRTAALAAGQVAEWRAYMDGIIAQHKRKYSLVPLLEPLR